MIVLSLIGRTMWADIAIAAFVLLNTIGFLAWWSIQNLRQVEDMRKWSEEMMDRDDEETK